MTDELTMVQAKFTQKVSGRVGIKPRWLDSQFRTTVPKPREIRTWAEESWPVDQHCFLTEEVPSKLRLE